MRMHPIGRRSGLALLGSLLGATLFGVTGAAAHHGWSWAEGDQGTLRGTIREIYIGAPHPTLRVEANGQLWLVELGNPRQTASAGFNAESASVGDEVVALGNRARTEGERRMKAVRITLRDRTYDIYPTRIQG